MSIEKRYLVNGIEKDFLDLTIGELCDVIENQKVDREFIEGAARYMWSPEMRKLAGSKQNQTDEIFKLFATVDMDGRLGEHEEYFWSYLRERFWDSVSSQRELPLQLMEKYERYLNWVSVNRFQEVDIIRNHFPDKVIEKHIIRNEDYRKKFGYDLLVKLKGITDSVRPLTDSEFRNHIIDAGIDQEYLTKLVPLTEELATYIGQHINHDQLLKNRLTSLGTIFKVTGDLTPSNGSKLKTNRKFSNEELERYAENLDWKILSGDRSLSEKTILKNIDRINWYEISLHQKLSAGFIKTYEKKLYPELLAINENIPFETLCDIDFIVEGYGDKLMERADSTEDFIRSELDKSEGEPHWNIISLNGSLSEEFLLEYGDHLDWPSISQCNSLSEEFIFNNLDKLDLDTLVFNKRLSLGIIKRLEEIKSLNYKF